MHEHIRQTVEELLNMIAESISMYKSADISELSGMAPNTLNSIIQSKENCLNDLLNEFNKIYPNFKPKSYSFNEQPIKNIYNNILDLENRIGTFIQNNLLPNIPSKGHEGIYTIAANIRSNSESSVVKLNNMFGIRSSAFIREEDLIRSTLLILACMEFYAKEGLKAQTELCKQLLEENKHLLEKDFNKKLLIYEPKYGDSYASICTVYNIRLSDLLKYNKIKNPYSKVLRQFLIIITKS